MISTRAYPHPQATSPLYVLMTNAAREEISERDEMAYENLFQMLYEDGSIMLYEA
jgi:hypothetical protein